MDAKNNSKRTQLHRDINSEITYLKRNKLSSCKLKTVVLSADHLTLKVKGS